MKCFIKTCFNIKSKRNSEKQFFCLPTSIIRRQEWIKAAGQKPETMSERYTTQRFVCEDHFEVRVYTFKFVACACIMYIALGSCLMYTLK